MNVKRLMAGGLAALAAGSTLAFGIFAASTSLGDYVKTGADAMSLSSPIIVVGDQAAAKDIVSAADIAAAVAGYATTSVTTTGGVATSVTGGVSVETSNTKGYLGDSTAKSGLKQTLTKNELSTLLASGVLTDGAGTKFNYDQYVKMATTSVAQNQFTFGRSDGDLNDPALIFDLGNASNIYPIYNLTVNFNKLLNISKTSADSAAVQGQELTLFGNKYTIGSGSNSSNKLILFGTSNSQLLTEGEEATIIVAGKEHKVKLEGVSSTTVAVLSVDGVSKEVTEGSTYTIAGVEVFADQVYYYTKEAQKSQAKVSFGTQKVTLEHGQSVKTGSGDDTVDGTLVGLTGTPNSGISSLSIAVTAKDTNNNYVKAGSCITDRVFGSFKICYNGLSGGATDNIVIDNAGNTKASLKFTDYRGFEKTLDWAYTGSSAFAPALNATSSQKYVVVEGELGRVNDFWVVAPERATVDVSDFGHILQLTTRSSFGSSGAYVELKDVFSAETSRVYLDSPDYANATFYLDGNAYYIRGVNSGEQWHITWGASSSVTSNGTKRTIWPLVPTGRGGWIAFTANASILANTTIYELPTNLSANFSLNRSTVDVTNTFGRVRYFANVSSGDVLNIGVQKATGPVASDYNPQILVLEEKGKDRQWNTGGTDTDVQDAVILSIEDGSGSGVDLTVRAPTLTTALSYSDSLQSDSSVTEYYDRYGTRVKHDTDNQGIVEIWYPDNQAVAQLAVGADPKFGTTAGGTTVESAIKIKSPVAKLDSEVTATATGVTGDLILVGGPCANDLVAQLMTDTTCDTWSYKKGVIKEYANAFGSGKKALVVAGTSADDTRWLASQVMQGVLSWSDPVTT